MKKTYIIPETKTVEVKSHKMVMTSMDKSDAVIIDNNDDVLSRENNAWVTPSNVWDD